MESEEGGADFSGEEDEDDVIIKEEEEAGGSSAQGSSNAQVCPFNIYTKKQPKLTIGKGPYTY